jgi:hypothetical protein
MEFIIALCFSTQGTDYQEKLTYRKLADWRAPKGEDRGAVRRKAQLFDCEAYAHEAFLSALMPDKKVFLSYRPKKALPTKQKVNGGC